MKHPSATSWLTLRASQQSKVSGHRPASISVYSGQDGGGWGLWGKSLQGLVLKPTAIVRIVTFEGHQCISSCYKNLHGGTNSETVTF